MSGMYDDVRVPDVQLKPYPHEGRGSQRGRAKDPVKYLQAAEQRARERQVAIETVKIARRDVIKCYRKEGVNHFDNCRDVAKKYYDLIQQPYGGRLQPKADE
mmetsp:Transcript_6165/g.8923  ORF Transcript_6165/g.8923 Transcript_6165/m.8923 type:complete len:102 (+) Transcript_6165:134-439(+)|eukprot:CAMPEP_0195510542 /NCGR_PEP_ID=MMETSP0794_2-20130614/3156_1 /TAXON_ID=515487 /ORGANISM="Stephanopyxis turris, Strain CCMP 815" /LENGTH=101 /DNA_ID=CAMNT_0040637973 /DNA_START=132 /DNA_END=437 /DNA_ORIENTATION=+